MFKDIFKQFDAKKFLVAQKNYSDSSLILLLKQESLYIF